MQKQHNIVCGPHYVFLHNYCYFRIRFHKLYQINEEAIADRGSITSFFIVYGRPQLGGTSTMSYIQRQLSRQITFFLCKQVLGALCII
jgi:hypothetical protein